MVAMNVWPTDAAAGSVANEAKWRKMGRLFAPSGIAMGVGGMLRPTLAYPNLTIADGACWVDGHYCELLGTQVLAVTTAGLCVVRFDPAANTADLVYRDAVSSPAQNPNGTWELPIAKIVASALVDARVGATNAVFDNAAARDAAWPNPPFGAMAISRDTGNTNFYYGTTVGWKAPWASAWGLQGNALATSTTPTSGGVSGAAADIGVSLTFTAVAGRNYLLQAQVTRVLVAGAGGATIECHFADGANTVLGYVCTGILLAQNVVGTFMGQALWAPGAGSKTVKLRGLSAGANAATFQSGNFVTSLAVLDVGPSNPAAVPTP